MKKPPRIKIPDGVKPGDIIEIKALATHIMETGNRKDTAGNKVPRDIIHTFTATFSGRAVFSAAIGSGIAANPYFAFFLKVPAPARSSSPGSTTRVRLRSRRCRSSSREVTTRALRPPAPAAASTRARP